MTSVLRRTIALGVIAGLLAVIVIVLLPGNEARTPEQRSHEIASNIKCPSCNGASIADANSSVARDLQVVIREQVDAGLSDADIYDYFVARYTEAALLSPPTSGWGLLLWLLPVVGLGIGVVVIMGRRRGRSTPRRSSVVQLADELEAIEQDLDDLKSQVAGGDLDEDTALRLRTSYETDAIAVRARLDEVEAVVAAGPSGRDRRRVLAGVAFVGVSLLVVGLSVGFAVRDRAPGGPITGDIVQRSADEGPVNLDEVSNEDMEVVVAENPENVPMRRALARRYFFAGTFDKAFDHYMTVLSIQLDAEALANVGWITYVGSDEVDTALGLVERSLAIEPDNPMAYWFLANIRFHGLDDAAGAIEPLEQFLAYPDVPQELRSEAETLLEMAEAAI